MTGLRLRTKFLLSVLLSTVALTCASLLVVRHSVEKQVREEVSADARNALTTFQNLQRVRETQLAHSAELLANLPTLKALMTTGDAATIQDASVDTWKLSGSGVFVLADRSGRVVALHTATPGLTRAAAQDALRTSLEDPAVNRWWFGAGHLYEVFVQPIFFGAPGDNTALGVVAVGYEIDDQLAADVARAAGSQVVFQYGDTIAVTTLPPAQHAEFRTHSRDFGGESRQNDVNLGGEKFILSSLELSPSSTRVPVRLIVLKSYDQATQFLRRINRLLLVLGIATVLMGGVVVFVISNTVTGPLKTLVAGVRSLGRGDYSYPLETRGTDEVAEVTRAFVRMRQTLYSTQQQLLRAERLATIGTMASSISHDLRHALTAVLANAEFLCDSRVKPGEREDLYQEIRVAVQQMTDLIESLVEFSRTRESLRPMLGDLREVINHAADAVRVHPEYHNLKVAISPDAPTTCWMDPKKIERVFYNLLLNACDSARPRVCGVAVGIAETNSSLIIRIADNGGGIAPQICDRLFQPFTSFGKENGSGLGLAVVQKIVQDHGGDISVESTSAAGTVFQLLLPTTPPETKSGANTPDEISLPPSAA